MKPQDEYDAGEPSPSRAGRWQGVGAYVMKFPGSIEDAENEVELSPRYVERTFDALFHKHLARLRYLKRQATGTVCSMFIAERERLRWPGSDAMELVRSLTVSTILARAKAYAEDAVPELMRWKPNVLC
jgi:hypothetical protein